MVMSAYRKPVPPPALYRTEVPELVIFICRLRGITAEQWAEEYLAEHDPESLELIKGRPMVRH
jgi:hypothetical protein